MPRKALGCRPRRGLCLPGIAVAAVICLPGAAGADDTARVVLLSVPDTAPDAEAVRGTLADHLSRVEVSVDVVKRAELPPTDDAWLALAREQAAETPGTLALFGWRCGAGGACELFVVEPRGGGLARIPVKPAEPSAGEGPAVAFSLAATARDAVWGGLLLEMVRLAEEGAHPEEPPPSGQRLPAPHQGAVDPGGLARAHRPWLWIEGGYHGEYVHPLGQTLHGPFVGLALSPGKNIVPVVRAGWLGMSRGEGEAGRVDAHCFPFELELRVAFPVGPAMFSVAPVGRVDVVVANRNPAGAPDESTSVEVDLHVGGMTTWHTPLPGGRLEALVAIGALATIIGNGLAVGGDEEIPSSRLRIVWSAGLSWSPL